MGARRVALIAERSHRSVDDGTRIEASFRPESVFMATVIDPTQNAQTPDPITELLRKLVAPSTRDAIARVIGETSATFEFELGADASGPATSHVVTLGPDGARIVTGALERVVAPGRLRVRAAREVFANIIQRPDAYISSAFSGSLTQQGNVLLAVHLERLLRELARTTPPDMPTDVPVETPRAPAIPWTFERVPNTQFRAAVRSVCARLQIQPALLVGLFGPPADGVHWRSSGTYRFTATATDAAPGSAPVLLDLFDEDKVYEVTERDEDPRAASFWGSDEAWHFELTASDGAIASAFLTWLTSRIDRASRDVVEAEVARARTHLASGALHEAQRALWAAWPHVAPDQQLEGASAKALRAVKVELEAAKARR